MANVSARKRGNKWEYRFEAASVNGKRKHISKGGFQTKKDALAAGVKALDEYNQCGLTFVPSEISFADYLDYWMENYVRKNCKYHTISNYERYISIYLKPALGSYKLKALNPMILQEYVNKLYASGKKKSYIKNLTSVLIGSLKYAVVPAGLIQYNPAAGLVYPKLEYDRREINRTVITVDQFDVIINRFPAGNPYRYALLIGFYTGMRIGETYGLTWDDIDLKAGTIHINKIMYKHDGRWSFGSTKTISSNRTVTIGKTLINELSIYKRIQKENELRYGEFYTECYINRSTDPKTGQSVSYIQEVQKCIGTALTEKVSPVFRKEDGVLSTVDSFKYCARVIHYDLGIPKFNYHSLRHTHATMLIEAGVNVKAVQERLGHSDIQTTMNAYVHNTDTMASNAMEVFEKIAHG